MIARRTVEDASAIGQLADQDELRDSARPLVFLPRREVERRVGMSKSTIYRRVADKTFPAPVYDVESSSAWWLEHEVDAWQRARVSLRDGAATTPEATGAA